MYVIKNVVLIWQQLICNFIFSGLPRVLPPNFSPSRRELWDPLWLVEPLLSFLLELTRENVLLSSNSWHPDSSLSPVRNQKFQKHFMQRIQCFGSLFCEDKVAIVTVEEMILNQFCNWSNFSFTLQDPWNWTVVPCEESTNVTFWLPRLAWMCLPSSCPKTSMMIISR